MLPQWPHVLQLLLPAALVQQPYLQMRAQLPATRMQTTVAAAAPLCCCAAVLYLSDQHYICASCNLPYVYLHTAAAPKAALFACIEPALLKEIKVANKPRVYKHACSCKASEETDGG
jgi:hypothetical protein